MDPYVDFTGRVTGYVVVNIAALMGDYDWRLADKNVWKVERVLLDHPHRPLRSSDARVDRLRARYRAFRAAHPGLQAGVLSRARPVDAVARRISLRGLIVDAGLHYSDDPRGIHRLHRRPAGGDFRLRSRQAMVAREPNGSAAGVSGTKTE